MNHDIAPQYSEILANTQSLGARRGAARNNCLARYPKFGVELVGVSVVSALRVAQHSLSAGRHWAGLSPPVGLKTDARGVADYFTTHNILGA